MRSIPANTLIPPKAPNLPIGPVEYDQRYTDQLNNALRLYFNELDNVVGLLAGTGTGGGAYLRFPYGSFSDTTTQTAASTTTAYVVSFNTTDYSNGVTLASGTNLTVTNAGIYNLQFSCQLNNEDNASQDVDIWFRKNGTDIANSNSRFGLAPRKSVGDPFHVIAGLNIYVSLSANDYVQLVWRASNTAVSIKTYAAGTSPTRPAVPSVIATLTFVSAPPA